MIIAALSLFIVLGLLLISEKLRKSRHLKPESTRKFIHITVGAFVAFWPFFMSNELIYVICGAFFGVVLISRYIGMFPSIHKVHRKTWGDILFPVGIALTLLIANDKWIFLACMLHLGLADGMAALIGDKYGKTNSYRILGYKKTLAGNLAFYLVSIIVVYWLVSFAPAGFSHLGLIALVWIPLVATVCESVSIRGTDNIVVPVVLALMLNSLQFIN